MYIADYYNHRVRKVTVSTGKISNIAGTGSTTFINGAASTSSTLYYPYDVAVDSAGNVYIADTSNSLVRKITSLATFSPSSMPSTTPTVLPSTASPTFAPSNLPTKQPSYSPSYIPTAIPTVASVITTIAGTGSATYSGDGGVATSAALNNPYGIAIDSSGIH